MRDVEDFVLPFSERWENLTLANDFMFGTVFQDEGLCLELVRLILPELDIERVVLREHQKALHETLDTYGVRFDVYLHDDKGRIINVEMQVADRRNLFNRMKACHAIMDFDAMDRSMKEIYENMPEVIVIFICAFYPFNLDKCVYTFKSVCIEERDLLMDDGASTVFLNTKGKDEDISPRLRAFLRYLEGESSDDEFVKRLEERLKIAKQNKYAKQEYLLARLKREENIEEGRREGLQQGIQQGLQQGMQEGLQQGRREGLQQGIQQGLQQGMQEGLQQGIQQGMQQGLQQGRREGLQQEKLQTANRMRNAGMTDYQISIATGLSLEEISTI